MTSAAAVMLSGIASVTGVRVRQPAWDQSSYAEDRRMVRWDTVRCQGAKLKTVGCWLGTEIDIISFNLCTLFRGPNPLPPRDTPAPASAQIAAADVTIRNAV